MMTVNDEVGLWFNGVLWEGRVRGRKGNEIVSNSNFISGQDPRVSRVSNISGDILIQNEF